MGTPSMFAAYETSGAVRKSDPAPSAEAARQVDVKGQRRVILDYLQHHMLVTADDLELVTGTHRSSWSSRLAGMHRDRLLDHATPVVKVTAGRRQTVTSFKLTAAGRELVEDAWPSGMRVPNQPEAWPIGMRVPMQPWAVHQQIDAVDEHDGMGR